MQHLKIGDLLERGKAAARRGDQVRARECLQVVVERNPEHEQAWLWLSAVVESDEQRRLCLENVLQLNPLNEAAKRGLRRLESQELANPSEDGEVVSRRATPLTPAGAILYPERQERSWRWHDPIKLRQSSYTNSFSTESGFNDIWTRDVELCAYCATELSEDDRRCSGCRRHLERTAYRYPKSSTSLVVYCVLILGISQVALATVFVTLLSNGSPATLAWQSMVFISMMALAAGLALRRFWAYVASIVALLMILAAIIFGRYLAPVFDESLAQLTGREFFLLLADRPLTFIAGPMGDLLRLLYYAVVPAALLVALFRVGPDFERVRERIAARLGRGISEPSHYYTAGVDLGQRGMWASAVLHFQRAAAKEPANPFYQRALGDAYGRLGHYQRGIDVLESAYQLTQDAELRAETSRQITEMKRHQAGILSQS